VVLVPPLFCYEEVSFYPIDLQVDMYMFSVCVFHLFRTCSPSVKILPSLSLIPICRIPLFPVIFLSSCIHHWCCVFDSFLLLLYTSPLTILVYLSSMRLVPLFLDHCTQLIVFVDFSVASFFLSAALSHLISIFFFAFLGVFPKTSSTVSVITFAASCVSSSISRSSCIKCFKTD